MAATTEAAPRLAALPPATRRAGLAGTLRSEWTKIKSVRSTYYSLVAMLVVCIGISAAIAAATAAQWSRTSAADKATFDPTQTSLGGMVFFGELVIVVLGTLIITSEFSTGMIRTSLTVMPRRPVIYAAKAIVLVLVALVVSFAAAFASFYLGQALLTNTHHTAMLSQPGVMRAVIGSALYTTLCGVFAYGVATLLRNAAATISSVIGVLFVLPIIFNFLPDSLRHDINRWLPSSTGDAMTQTVGAPDAHLFSAWGEFAVFGAYTLIILIVGAVIFSRRDA